MRQKHQDAFNNFNDTFPVTVVAKWEKLVTDWDADKHMPNLYEEPVAGIFSCTMMFYFLFIFP